MSSLDQVASAFAELSTAWSSGRLAHAYLIQGSPRGEGGLFVQSMLQWLYCEQDPKPCGRCRGCHHVEQHAHADVMWLEPESRSRQISIDQARQLTGRLAQTSLEGGWKVGVMLEADRMTAQAANALLKTLEEPPGRSMLVLVSDSPQAILPTILSRCQIIKLSAASACPQGPWLDALIDLLREVRPGDPGFPLMRAAKLKQLLHEVRAEAEESDEDSDDEGASKQTKEIREARLKSRVLRARTDMLTAMTLWYRDVAACAAGAPARVLHFPDQIEALSRQADGLGWTGAVHQVREMERLSRDVDMNVSDLSALEIFLPS